VPPITEEAIRACLHTHTFGRDIRVEPCLPSTNTTAKELAAAGASEGTVVIARRQTAGRGRLGRSFSSPEGGVYMSLILRPAADTDPGLVTSCGAVAVARAIRRQCDLPVGIKWVNDLFIHGRKVCGILAEGVLDPTGGLTAIVLGLGIKREWLGDIMVDGSTSVDSEWPAMSSAVRQIGADFLNGSGNTQLTLMAFGISPTVVKAHITSYAELDALLDQYQGNLLYGRSGTNCSAAFDGVREYITNHDETLADAVVIYISDGRVNLNNKTYVWENCVNYVLSANNAADAFLEERT